MQLKTENKKKFHHREKPKKNTKNKKGIEYLCFYFSCLYSSRYICGKINLHTSVAILSMNVWSCKTAKITPSKSRRAFSKASKVKKSRIDSKGRRRYPQAFHMLHVAQPIQIIDRGSLNKLPFVVQGWTVYLPQYRPLH